MASKTKGQCQFCGRPEGYRTRAGNKQGFHESIETCQRCYHYIWRWMQRTPKDLIQRMGNVERWSTLLGTSQPMIGADRSKLKSKLGGKRGRGKLRAAG